MIDEQNRIGAKHVGMMSKFEVFATLVPLVLKFRFKTSRCGPSHDSIALRCQRNGAKGMGK